LAGQDDHDDWSRKLQNLAERLAKSEITHEDAERELAEMKAAALADGRMLNVSLIVTDPAPAVRRPPRRQRRFR
jgi:hypothetical protein